jgi:hypothetical protein
MSLEDLLVLDKGGFGRRLEALYGRLARDTALREYFIKDPGAVLDETVFRNFPAASPKKLNQFNRALYAVLSNPEFMQWGEEFRARLIERARSTYPDLEDQNQALRAYLVRMDRRELHAELVRVLPKFMDEELAYASFGFSGRPSPAPPGPVPLPDPCPDVPGGGGPDLGGPCTTPRPPVGPNPIGDVVVAAETAVVVVAVAVFVVAVTMIDFTPKVSPVGLSREDVRTALASMNQKMLERAEEVRRGGALRDTATFDGPWRG